jgi:hypothetical protein
VYDTPVPWKSGSCNIGAWVMRYEIPANQLDGCGFLWKMEI